eukprot:gene10436-21778_t
MRRDIGAVGQGDSPQEWYQSLPIITKILLTSGFLLAAMVSMGQINAISLVFIWPEIWGKFQIWRLFTSFLFVGTFSFNFVFHMFILYQNSIRYEVNPFNTGAGGSSADYLWMLLFGMAALSVIAYIFDFVLLGEPFLYMIMYVWCRREPEAITNIFGFKFRALYLPWVYMALRVLMGGDIVMMLIGVGVGHLYYFLVDVLPHTHGYNLIKTPKFCIDVIQYMTGVTQIQRGMPPSTAAAADRGFQQRGHTWGQGRTLGAD